ncbi:MAG: hypothetical protein ACQET5_16230 [Halobacteriota archaeon]
MIVEASTTVGEGLIGFGPSEGPVEGLVGEPDDATGSFGGSADV